MARQRKVEPVEQWVDGTSEAPQRRSRLATPAAPVTPAEKRRFERLAVSRQAVATELDQFGSPGSPFECTVSNISRGGLGICAGRMVHIDRRIFIEVAGQAGETPRLFYGMVRQVRYVEAQGYIVGIQFEPVPKSGPIDTWLTQRKARLKQA